MKNKVWTEDLENLIHADWIPWDRLRQKTVLITGANGLIGSSLVKGLAYANQKLNLDIRILALVRNKDKAFEKFADEIVDNHSLTVIQGDIESDIDVPWRVNFIVHGASPTASRYFVENPVETIKTSVNGTMNMLELAKKDQVEGFVYLSSMEVYGTPQNEDLLTEKDVGYIDPLLVRNCYPESKRLCEALCAAYVEEYDISAKIIRLTQTFGPGVEKNDSRIFAEIVQCVRDRKDIVLLTNGESKRCYLYTMDSVSAILTVLLKGQNGKSYNAGNPKTYCSIKEMVQMVAHELANDEIAVKVSNNKESNKNFLAFHFCHMDMNALYGLGWKPIWGLIEMYRRVMESEGTV